MKNDGFPDSIIHVLVPLAFALPFVVIVNLLLLVNTINTLNIETFIQQMFAKIDTRDAGLQIRLGFTWIRIRPSRKNGARI